MSCRLYKDITCSTRIQLIMVGGEKVEWVIAKYTGGLWKSKPMVFLFERETQLEYIPPYINVFIVKLDSHSPVDNRILRNPKLENLE